MTNLSQSNNRDDTNQDSLPAIFLRINQSSKGNVPGLGGKEFSGAAIKSGNCNNEGFSQNPCQMLNNEGSKEVGEGTQTISQSIPSSKSNAQKQDIELESPLGGLYEI